ncbi:MAG TPA: DEAD/DEAH box helicase [Thermoleophilia bacterium]|nr:DEAD/DEAH box helicase [Thermoleophilia bacterium]
MARGTESTCADVGGREDLAPGGGHASAGVHERLRALFTSGDHEQVVAVAHEAARSARYAPLPGGLHPGVASALAAAGVERLWSHQRETYDLLAEGRNVVVATGTASGKSLCFVIPTLDAAARDPQARALYLYPTKALAQDQARNLAALRADALPGQRTERGKVRGRPGAEAREATEAARAATSADSAEALRAVVPAIYDGDTPQDQRAAIRRNATIVLSNPDMVHVGILPAHERWAEFLHHLKYVVLDEAHVYRGVFGSHVAQVVRRLRRLCEVYGSAPQFILTSATIAEPRGFAERLVGLPFEAIEQDGAPHPERTIVFWNPPLEDPDLGTRRSSLAESSYIVSEAVLAGARVIAFAPTRKAAELVFDHVRRRLQDRDPGGAGERVQPYRAGYTPEQRRDIERRLFGHELDAVITTSALELGIDVGSLDLALVTGFPGTVTSLRQRWGRAGRAGHGWAVLVAGQDALDQYFMREPDRLLDRQVEEAIIDLDNPHISDAHLQAAAYERPLVPDDERFFGERGILRAEALAQAGKLRRRGGGLAWARPHSPAAEVSLRSASAETFVIVETQGGEILGTIEEERVFRVAHRGAVYLHLGRSYLVTDLDLDGRTVIVAEHDGTFYTQAKIDKDVAIAGQAAMRPLAGAALFFGEIEVTEQVIAYQKRDLVDGRVIDTVNLDLPEQTFTTEALWFTLGPEVVARVAPPSGTDAQIEPELAGALHAAEHGLIALLPLYAMCDRWDIGGLSTPWHWQTDRATVFIYDGYPGGIGLSKRGFEAFEDLAGDTLRLIAACPCESGCPSCVQSPKCGNLNEPLSKAGAVRLLTAILPPA